jgi:hypothetical protein
VQSDTKCPRLLGARYEETISGKREQVRKEYERIAAAEGNALMRILLYDKDSLQRRSEAEAAGKIADALAEAAKEETDKDAERLFKSLETLIEEGGGAGVEAESLEGWLDQFNAAFEKGLAEWTAAERQFIAERSRWEQEAEEIYLESEQVWADAYGALREKRKEWERSIQERLDEGKAAWRSEGEQLERMLERARAEFEAAAGEERARAEQEIAMQITLYTQSREIIETALEGIGYWYERWGEKYKGAYYYWKAEDSDPEDLVRWYEEWKEGYAQSVHEQYMGLITEKADGKAAAEQKIKDLQDEIEKLEEKINTINAAEAEEGPSVPAAVENYIREKQVLEDMLAGEQALLVLTAAALERLTREESLRQLEGIRGDLAIGDLAERLENLSGYREEEAGKTEGYREYMAPCTELREWAEMLKTYKERAGAAAAGLYGITGGILEAEGAFRYYDELELEMLKARAVGEYWRKEAEIAEAVERYVMTASSDKEAERETEEALKAAAEGYREAAEAYQEAVEALEAEYEAAGGAREAVQAAQARMNKLKAGVEEAREAYSGALLLLKGVGDQAVKEKIQELLIRLGKPPEEEEAAEAREAYNAAALRYAEAAAEAETNQVLAELINGNISGLKGLREMRERLAAAEAALAAGEAGWKQELAEIPQEYSGLRIILEEQREAAGREGAPEAEKELAVKLLEQGWKIAVRYWKDEIERREAAVRYILTGERLEAGPVEAGGELVIWLEAQRELLVDLASVCGGAEQEYLQELDALLEWVLSEPDDISGVRTKLEAVREEEGIQQLLRGESLFDRYAPGYGQYYYGYKLSESGLVQGPRAADIEARYGAYAYIMRNKNNRDAREAVRAYRERYEQDLEGYIKEGRISGIYGYIQGIQEAGAGLNAGGLAALDQYLEGVYGYIAAAGISRKEALGIPGSGAALEALKAAAREASVYGEWEYQVYTLEGVLGIAGSEYYRGAAREALEESITALLAWLIMEKAVQSELRGCGTAAGVYELFKEWADAGVPVLEGVQGLGEREKEAIAGHIVNIFGEGEAEYRKYDLFLEWLALEAGDPARAGGIYADDAIIKAVQEGLTVQERYLQYRIERAALEADLDAALSGLSETEGELEAVEQESLEYEEQIAALEEQIAALEERIAVLEERTAALEEEYAEERERFAGIEEVCGASWIPYYLEGAEALYCYLLSPQGYGGGAEGLAYLAGLDPGLAGEVETYYRRQEAVNGYLTLLDGDIETYLERAAGLTVEDKAAVREALASGTGMARMWINRAAAAERVKPSGLERSGVIGNMQQAARGEAAREIGALAEEKRKSLGVLEAGRRLGLAFEAEEAASRTAWIDALQGSGADSGLERYTGEEQAAVTAMTAPGSKDAQLMRLYGQLAERAAYFEAERDEGVRFTAGSIEEILHAGAYIPAASDDVGLAAQGLDAAGRKYQGVLNWSKAFEQSISRYLVTLKELAVHKNDAATYAARKRAELAAAEEEYGRSQRACGDAVEGLERALEAYNERMEEAGSAFERAEREKVEMRKRREIYEWASSVYLEGFGTNSDAGYISPTEKAAQTRYALSRAELAVQVVEELAGKRGEADAGYTGAYREYEKAYREYYTARVTAYEANKEIERMREVVREAERTERTALGRLVSENMDGYFPSGDGAEPRPLPDSLEFVRVEKAGGSWQISLVYEIGARIEYETVMETDGEGNTVPVTVTKEAAELQRTAGRNSEQEALSGYFTDATEAFELVDDRENRKSRAAVEALEWLEGIHRLEGGAGRGILRTWGWRICICGM